ncbi:MAG: IS982 family transposase [Armatimonadota bacterium]
MKQRFGSSNMPRQHRGPRADEFSDSETLTVLLVGELCHVRREHAWLRQVRSSHLSMFPHLPEDSRFSRRAQQVRHLLQEIRQAILYWADADLEPIRILDSFPMPLCACYRIRQSNLPISSSAFGYNDSKRCWYFGLRPCVVMTDSGYIEDIVLSPGNTHDATFLAWYLDERIKHGPDPFGQDWIMDKGFINNKLAAWAKENLNLNLLARQRDKKGQEPSFWQVLIDKIRKPIEAVISVLTECFGIEHILARTDIGLYRRVQAKATAFSLARYFNQILGVDPMSIAAYAV